MKKNLLFLCLIAFFACQNVSSEQTPPQEQKDSIAFGKSIDSNLAIMKRVNDSLDNEPAEIKKAKQDSYNNEKLSKLNFDSGKVFKDSLPNTIDPFPLDEWGTKKHFKIDSIFKNKKAVEELFKMLVCIGSVKNCEDSDEYKYTVQMNDNSTWVANPDFLNDQVSAYNRLEKLSFAFYISWNSPKTFYLPIKKIEHLLKPKFVAELHRRYKF